MRSFTKDLLPESYPNIRNDGEDVCSLCSSSQPSVYRSGAITHPEDLTRLQTNNNLYHLPLAEIFAKLDLPVEKSYRAVEKAKHTA